MLKNVGSNWIVTLATVLALYLLTPFTLHQLGAAGYGTWILIASLNGYLGLLALGVPMASVRYFAQHVATGDTQKLNEAINAVLRMQEVRERLEALTLEPVGGSPREFADYVRAEVVKWGAVVKQTGAKVD